MRRIVFSAVIALVIAGCASPRLRWPFPDAPGVVVQWPIGNSGLAPPPPPPEPRPVPCREISRIACDLVHCEGPNFDFVVVQCAGKPSSGHCEINGGCGVKSEDDGGGN